MICLDSIDSSVNKIYLLDMLAFLLWNEGVHDELGPRHISLGKALYKEILNDLKRETTHRKNSPFREEDFDTINRECQALSLEFFLEKRLALIEGKLAKRG